MPTPALLSLLALPVLGAFIGYLTNYVAIRMLFRPLRPWRVLGFALPMTPGVIPRKRQELAQNIGRMVGGHLLTSADVSKALANESFQKELESLITSRLEMVLHKELGPVATLVPARFRGYFDMGIKILRWRSAKHLHTYLESEAFAASVARVVDRKMAHLLARQPGLLVPEPERARLCAGLAKVGGEILASPWLEAWLRAQIEARLQAASTSEYPLRELLPIELTRMLLTQLEAEAPRLLQGLAKRLEEPQVRDRIARAVVQAINNFIQTLGPLAGMVANFINPEMIDRKVRAYLAERGGDLTSWLFDETVQHRVADLLRERLDGFLATPVATLLQRMGPERTEKIREELVSQLLARLRKPETADLLSAFLHQGFAQVADRPLGETLTALAGEEGVARGQAWATREIVSLLRTPETRKVLDHMLGDILAQRILAQPIGTLASFLPREVQKGAGEYLLQLVGDLLTREVPGLVDSLNIEEIVARKVDSLDLLRLEGLLLGIMQEQFKYINLFGALLGFLIGGLNLVLLLIF